MTSWRPMGDRAWRAALPDGHDPRAVLTHLRAMPGVRDVVLSETHCLVCAEGPVALPSLDDLAPGDRSEVRVHVIAVRYDGPDLDDVASRAGLTVDDVVARHTGAEYTVLAVGFLPGFAYLGPLDPSLVLPRRDSPRPRVPAGSVGVAGARTGVYPFASPGGWHLLGRALDHTPFDVEHGARWQVGDRVRFEAR